MIPEILQLMAELRIHQKSFFILTQKAKSNPKLYEQRKQELAICKELEAKIDAQLGEHFPDYNERLAVLVSTLDHL